MRVLSRGWILYGYIVFSYLLGITLCMGPWSRLWETNFFIDALDIRHSAVAGWIRGAISGLGAINLFLALRSIYEVPKPGTRRKEDGGAVSQE